LELDGFCEQLKIAFEHQGGQHYDSKSRFSGSVFELRKRKKIDAFKVKIAKIMNVKLIIVPEVPRLLSYQDLPKFLIDEFKSVGLKPKLNSKKVWIEHSKLYSPRVELEWNRLLVKVNEQNGEILSKEYLTARAPMRFRCQFGHEFVNSAFKINLGQWCKICVFKKRRGKFRLNIDVFKERANAKGGICLSNEYNGISSKLRFQCVRNHKWEAFPIVILRGGWCKKCGDATNAERMRLGIEKMRELARSRDGECISDTYKNARSKLEWKCSVGHIWAAIPGNVIKGHWCPYCGWRVKKGK